MKTLLSDAALVGTGAAAGALARFVLTILCPAALWPLLVANIAGSLAMGYFQPGLFWGTGVLGGFTSFSAFSLVLLQNSPGLAVTYLIVTVIGCVAAWLLGDALRKKVA